MTKMWIGYGTNSNGENPTYKIFSDVKLCAIHIYARNIGDNNDEKLVDILKTLIRELILFFQILTLVNNSY